MLFWKAVVMSTPVWLAMQRSTHKTSAISSSILSFSPSLKNNNQPSTIMTLEEAQKQVDQWVKTYGVRYFSELTNMAVLTEEVGELARVIIVDG